MNKFNKHYLDSLYVERNEIIKLCANDPNRDPPPCWSPKELSSTDNAPDEDPDNENNGWYDKITKRRREKVVCIELAKQLWVKYPGLSYKEMHEHPTMK